MVMIIPKDYKCEMGVLETQKAIKELKDFFQNELASELNLLRVSSPLFVLPETGTNECTISAFLFKNGTVNETGVSIPFKLSLVPVSGREQP